LVNALSGADDQPHLVPVEDPAFAGGKSVEGVFHLLGNVSEWTTTPKGCDSYPCQDPWALGSTAPVSLRVVGHSMREQILVDRTFEFIATEPTFRDGEIGFRCARS
jgi:formylglycine-generating enzyme required for sulfatase activity